MRKRTRILGRTLAAAGTLAALTVATAVPATAAPQAKAAEPTSVEQDIAQLYQDVEDLYNGLPANALRGVDPLFDSPVKRPGQQAHAAQGPIPGCTEGSLLTYANKLASSLNPTEAKALSALSAIGQLYTQAVASDKTPQVFGTDGQYTPRSRARRSTSCAGSGTSKAGTSSWSPGRAPTWAARNAPRRRSSSASTRSGPRKRARSRPRCSTRSRRCRAAATRC